MKRPSPLQVRWSSARLNPGLQEQEKDPTELLQSWLHPAVRSVHSFTSERHREVSQGFFCFFVLNYSLSIEACALIINEKNTGIYGSFSLPKILDKTRSGFLYVCVIGQNNQLEMSGIFNGQSSTSCACPTCARARVDAETEPGATAAPEAADGVGAELRAHAARGRAFVHVCSGTRKMDRKQFPFDMFP